MAWNMKGGNDSMAKILCRLKVVSLMECISTIQLRKILTGSPSRSKDIFMRVFDLAGKKFENIEMVMQVNFGF